MIDTPGKEPKPGRGLPLPPLPDRRTLAMLAVVVLFGFVLRMWGLRWGLPDARHPASTYHPDETINLFAARSVDLLSGQFDTKFYSYGTLYFYLVALAHLFGRGYGFIPAPKQNPVLDDLTREAAALFLTGRSVSVLLGTLTIIALFALGNRLHGHRVGLTAALLYAVAPLAVVHAHFLTVDVAATFFVTLALVGAARLLDAPTLKNALWAGVFVGLSAATKYNAGLVLVAPLIALFAAYRRPTKPITSLPLPGKAILGLGLALLAATVATFLIACPGPLINWDAFWNGTYPGSGVRYELFEHSRQGHGELFVNTGPGWWYHLRISLLFGLGVPLTAMSLWGFVEVLRLRQRKDWPMLAFFILSFALAGLSAVRFARYLLPLYPVLCLWAAGVAFRPLPQPGRKILGGVVGILTAIYGISLVNAMATPDPRDRAADYLERNPKPEVSYAFAKVPWFFSPPLLPGFGAVNPVARAEAAATYKTLRDFRIPATEWDASNLTPPPDYAIVSNFETMHALRLDNVKARSWLDRAAVGRNKVVFAPTAVLGLPKFGPLVPDDILYVLPEITVYENR